MKNTSYTSLLCALFLSGCSTYNEDFDCEPGKGVGCKSLSQVNRMVDEGAFGVEEEDKTVETAAVVPSQKQLRIWVAGYEEGDGTIHEPSVLYVPLKSGK